MTSRVRLPRLDGLRVTTWVLLVILVILSVYPTVTLLMGAFRDGSPFSSTSGWGLEGFAAAYGSAESFPTIRNSLILAVTLAVLGTGLGFLFAWMRTRTRVPLRGILTPVMVITVALPSLFNAMSWSVLGSDRAGLINQLARSVLGPDVTVIDIYSWGGVLAISLIKPIAVAYLLLLGPCRSLSRSIEEAAVISGSGSVRALVTVTAPVLAPTMLAVAILNLIIGLEAFDVPALLAVPAGIPLLSTAVFSHINDSIPPDYPAASALALGICVLVLSLVALRWRLIGGRSFATVTGKAREGKPWNVGAWAPLFTTLIVVFTLLALVVPLFQLIFGSFQPIFGSVKNLGLANWTAVLGDSDVIASVLRSLAIGVGGGFLAMLFTLIVAYVIRHAGGRVATRVLDLATWLPAALPGVVLGLSLSWAYLSLPFLRPFYGTPVMLILALMVAGLPLAARASEGSLLQIHRELEEASRIGGASPIVTIRTVLLPLIAPSFLAGWLLTSLYVAGRLDVPVLLSTGSNRMSIVVVFELYSNGRTGEAAAVFCLLLVGFMLIAGVMAAIGWLLRITVQKSARHGNRESLDAARPLTTEAIVTTAGDRNG